MTSIHHLGDGVNPPASPPKPGDAPSPVENSPQREEFPLPPTTTPLAMAGFAIYRQLWNILVGIDRQDGSLNNRDLRPVLKEAIQTILMDEGAKWLPFAEAVVREFQERRSKCPRGLRYKAENRLSTIPVVGPLAILGLDSHHDRRILRRKGGAIVVIRLLPGE
jgi:hypothetical protein